MSLSVCVHPQVCVSMCTCACVRAHGSAHVPRHVWSLHSCVCVSACNLSTTLCVCMWVCVHSATVCACPHVYVWGLCFLLFSRSASDSPSHNQRNSSRPRTRPGQPWENGSSGRDGNVSFYGSLSRHCLQTCRAAQVHSCLLPGSGTEHASCWAASEMQQGVGEGGLTPSQLCSFRSVPPPTPPVPLFSYSALASPTFSTSLLTLPLPSLPCCLIGNPSGSVSGSAVQP